MAKANALYRAGAFHDALELYEGIALRPGWAALVHANVVLCRKRLRAGAEGQGVSNRQAAILADSPVIVVTITTIRSRLQYMPIVIESLLKQTLKPVRIDLNISQQPYLLDEGITPDDPVLVALMGMPSLYVNWVPNIGSYRKIWPFIESHFSQVIAKDSVFVTCDDDTIYPDYFLEHLYKSYLRHDCVVAFRGRHIEVDQQGLMPYDKWTLGQIQPSLCNLPTGKDGILYSTKFFTKEILNLVEAQRIAPTADDLWIKWHCALNGVPSVILNPEACTSDYRSFPVVNYDHDFRDKSLYACHNSTNSQNKNDISVENLERYFLDCYGYNLTTLLLAEQNGSPA
jgi:hypothetical protein